VTDIVGCGQPDRDQVGRLAAAQAQRTDQADRDIGRRAIEFQRRAESLVIACGPLLQRADRGGADRDPRGADSDRAVDSARCNIAANGG